MKKANIVLVFVVLLFFPGNILGEKIYLSLQFVGIKMVKAVFEEKANVIEISAKSTPLASISTKLDNKYIIEFEDEYLPRKYTKKIKQSDYSEDRFTIYDRTNLSAKRVSLLDSTKNCVYDIQPKVRDFFSALYFLRKNFRKGDGELILDGNRVLWKASYKILGIETINSVLGKLETVKIRIDFKKISPQEKERSDLLTNNLVNEKKHLFFWFTNDDKGIPVQAKYPVSPFYITWKLEKYEN